MHKELDPTSNVGDLVDYLLDHDVIMHIFPPSSRESSFEIRADRINTCGERARCAKRIDLNQYKCAPPELRNMIVTQAIYSIIEELVYL